MAEFKFEIEDYLVTPEVNDFCEVASNCVNLYSKKNHDYGDSFNKGMNAIGPAYGIGRIFDKVNRLVTLSKSTETACAVTDESIEDTLKDLACYAIMMLAYRKCQRINIHEQIELD